MRLSTKPSFRAGLSPERRLRLTPGIRASLHVLQLPLGELETHLHKEMGSNPFLEHFEKGDTFYRAGPSLGVHDAASESAYEIPDEKRVSLEEHLGEQLSFLNLSSREESAAQKIIQNLEADAYFRRSISQTALECQADPAFVQNVLRIVQRLDPPGVAARNLEECLAIQLERLIETSRTPARLLAIRIVKGHLNDLGLKRYAKIAKTLSVSSSEVEDAAKEIRRLNPKPGLAFQPPSPPIRPDVAIRKIKNRYEISCSQKDLPPLRMSPYYRAVLRDPQTPASVKEYLRSKLDSAVRFLKALEERGSTLERISKCIVDKQKEFLEKGPEHLKSFTLDEAAGFLGLHKSTVWRAAAHKYVETPQGLFPLKIFFSRGLSKGGPYSTAGIKARMRRLIASENSGKPLSDEKIVKLFKSQGIVVSRRTIAKYRAQLQILPSYLRK